VGASDHFKARKFYKTLMSVFNAMDEDELDDLMNWWNECVIILLDSNYLLPLITGRCSLVLMDLMTRMGPPRLLLEERHR
jgi:hypothetical protein